MGGACSGVWVFGGLCRSVAGGERGAGGVCGCVTACLFGGNGVRSGGILERRWTRG